MLYIALALILVGLLCFIYVSFLPSGKQGNPTPSPVRASYSHPSDRKILKEALVGTKKNPQAESVSEYDRMFAENRKIPPSFPSSHFQEVREEERMQEEDRTWMEEIRSEPIRQEEQTIRTETVRAETPAHSDPEPSTQEWWSMEGVLFLDLSGKLPYENLKERIRPEQLKGFRRIGEGRVQEIQGGFCFHALNSEFKYRFDEVEKVVFYDEGFALLPSKREYPVPIFLTSDTEKFKSYLENVSR
ncbi:LIC_11490 family protein [Leptospira fluminis]|nr:hypothetical protein [Leptospira fluminis]